MSARCDAVVIPSGLAGRACERHSDESDRSKRPAHGEPRAV
jgi:hypothetical protein